ncbi:hypothetical protein ACFW6K_05260 [Streptomyces sp. NPDC058733]|uniref:hypothetical protein n=1 Tax=unclassified Streptomyces TaxID=2593676 RepID=UPI0034515421
MFPSAASASPFTSAEARQPTTGSAAGSPAAQQEVTDDGPARTNGMRPALGTDRVLGNETVKVGFDPADSVMYVWSDYVEWNEQQVEAWAGLAAQEACRALVRERESSGSAWPYSRYAVAEIGGSHYLMIRWGTAVTETDCPA